MEGLGEKIEKFLSVSDGSGSGFGYGHGYDYGDGFGDGDGFDYGDGNGSGHGSGDGNGSGSGFGYDYDYGYGSGSGYGNGSSNGSGCGYDDSDGIKEFNGEKVYKVDGVQTLIYSVHGNYARGAIIRKDLTLRPCYIAKANDSFAHGETLKKAKEAALQKVCQDMSEEQRIDAFLAAHPDEDRKYSYDDLFRWHNILTGSCEMGRREFCKERGITEKDSFTIKEFCEITKDAYGGNIIKQLESRL